MGLILFIFLVIQLGAAMGENRMDFGYYHRMVCGNVSDFLGHLKASVFSFQVWPVNSSSQFKKRLQSEPAG
jgi:hypothetical protein